MFFSLPFKGRAGAGMVLPSGIAMFPGANTIPTQPSP